MLKSFRNVYFFIFTLFGLLFLSSCVDDTEPNPRPTITFNPLADRITVAPGDSVNKLEITVNSTDILKTFTIEKAGLGSPFLKRENDLPLHNYKTKLLDKVDTAATEGEIFIYTISAGTANGEVTSRKFYVEVSLTSVFENVSLGNQNSQANGNAFATKTGAVYKATSADTVAAAIDLVYYHYGAGGGNLSALGATLAAPADSTAQLAYSKITTWSQKNATELKLLGNDPELYQNATTGPKIKLAFGAGPGGSRITALAKDAVFAFKTAAGKYGIARVLQLAPPTTGTGPGTIRLAVRVQR